MSGERLFLSLLFPPVGAEGILPAGEDLETAFELAAPLRLHLLLYSRLTRMPGADDTEVRAFLDARRQAYLANAARSARQEQTGNEVAELLGRQGVESCLFKGAGLARELYGDADCRISTDIDILVRQRDAITADTALADAGYRREEQTPLAFRLTRLHHAVYRHPVTDDIVELHWHFAIPSHFNVDSEAIWDGIGRIDGCAVLLPEMQFIMLLMHHHLHAFRELRVLVDILWAFWRYERDIEWEGLARRLGEFGLARATLITLGQIKVLWETEQQVLKGPDILSEQFCAAGVRLPRYLASHFSIGLSEQHVFQAPGDRLMARLALDGRMRTARSFVRSLIPPRDEIRALYGDGPGSALPQAYLRFAAWRIREWIG